MATAPNETALSIKPCPSDCVPLIAINNDPSLTFLESKQIILTSTSVLPEAEVIGTLYNMSFRMAINLVSGKF